MVSVLFGSAEVYTTACPINMNSSSLPDWCKQHQLQAAVFNNSKGWTDVPLELCLYFITLQCEENKDYQLSDAVTAAFKLVFPVCHPKAALPAQPSLSLSCSHIAEFCAELE